jgi:transposase-like protein
MANKTSMKYSPEVRERAVRLVFEHQGERAPSGR